MTSPYPPKLKCHEIHIMAQLKRDNQAAGLGSVSNHRKGNPPNQTLNGWVK